MTSKGVKVQLKVTFDKPVTGFGALLQGGTSCFARRVKSRQLDDCIDNRNYVLAHKYIIYIRVRPSS